MLLIFSSLLVISTVLSPLKASGTDQRDCPAGYFYAGEDSTNSKTLVGDNTRANVFYEEVARSDVYSCYKIIDHQPKGERLVYFDAMKACSDEVNEVHNKARLVSFDNGLSEIKRFSWEIFKDSKATTKSILTSGLRLPFYSNFVWSSTNSLYNISEAQIKINGKENPKMACLVLKVNTSRSYSLEAVNCKDTKALSYACEVRVQMVTFYMWFMTNSWNLILMFTIVILGIALCMSGFAYKSAGPRVMTRRVIATPAPPTIAKPDLPPSYETYANAQRVHEGLPPKYAENGEQISRLDQLKNKGKEIITSVTILRPRN